MDKTLPSFFYDLQNGEAAIACLDGIRISDFYCEVDSMVFITDRRIIAIPSGSIQGKGAALTNPANYYDIKEITDIRTIGFSMGIASSFVNLTYHNGVQVQLIATPDKVEEMLAILRPLVSQPIPLLRFPEGETVLFKSGPGIPFLPFLDTAVRREVFWTAFDIQMVLTNRRVMFYRVNQIGKFSHGTFGVSAEFCSPGLQSINIPVQDIMSVSVTKGLLSGVALKLNKPVHGFELPSLAVFSVEDLIFEQPRHTCKRCGKPFKGEKVDVHPAEQLEGYVCRCCGASLCAGCIKQGIFSDKIQCPTCRQKAKPAAYVVSSKSRVTTRRSLEKYIPGINSGEYFATPMGNDGKEWELIICESKWKDTVLPAMQQVLPGEKTAQQQLTEQGSICGREKENDHRTVYDFNCGQDVWSIVDEWAKKQGYLTVQPGDTHRVYQKGNINWSAPTMLEISYKDGCGHLEAWLMFDEAAAKLSGASCEMPLKSGGLRAAGKRNKARQEVNVLLERFRLPPIG